MKYDLVIIHWKDTLSYEEWGEIEFLATDRPVSVYTCGFLVHEDKECVTLLQNVCPELGTGFHTVSIPKSFIREIERPGKQKKKKVTFRGGSKKRC